MTKKKSAAADTDEGCTLRELPVVEQMAAAEDAIAENPVNAPNPVGVAALQAIMNRLAELAEVEAPVLERQHIAFLTQKYWGAGGVKLSVGFLESTPTDLKNRILSHANAWGEFCNATFALTASASSADVRITLAGQGYWSYMGTDIRRVQGATMCLQRFTMATPESEFVRVVRHEFGHTLGCPHEHMRPEIVAMIDEGKAIEYFARTQRWTAEQVRQQVLTPLGQASIMGSKPDTGSIMCYSLPGSIMKDGVGVLGGADFTATDRTFVSSIMPLPVAPPLPPVGGGWKLTITGQGEKPIIQVA